MRENKEKEDWAFQKSKKLQRSPEERRTGEIELRTRKIRRRNMGKKERAE